MPKVISNLYQKINQAFGVSLIPVLENEFYSPSEILPQRSWKLNFTDEIVSQALKPFLLQELKITDVETSDLGGGKIEGFQNDQIICYHIYGYNGGTPGNWTDHFDYLSCAEK